MELFVSRKIKIASSPIHGLGVFATADISAKELIEECPFLDLGLKSTDQSSLLLDYRFNYPSGPMTSETKQVIVLGAGSIYNHSNNPSAYWVTDAMRRTFKFFAIRNIPAGEEIFTYYGGPEYWKDGRTNIEVK